MCSTPWCYGDCDECEADKKRQKEYAESSAVCPYRKECKWVTVNVKLDECKTCGKTFSYP